MKVLTDNLISLPEGLSTTEMYKLMKLFDEEIVKDYQMDFNVEDEFPAVTEALRVFYKYPERTDDGEVDVEAGDIDINYLSFIVQSYKATRLFSEVISNDDFNIETTAETFVKIDPDYPMDIILNFSILSSQDVDTSVESIKRMINHLLYFHNLVTRIETYIQDIDLEIDDTISVALRYINQAYYEQYRKTTI